MQEKILSLLLALPAFILAFTIHEFAHAWMANRLGDDTPRRLGRLTLDPVSHLDPLGSLMFVLTHFVGFGIGWAKPVPFNPRNFDQPRRDIMLVAVAGPISNLLQVPFWFATLYLLRVFGLTGDAGILGFSDANYSPASMVVTMLSMGILVNIVLAVFNLIPFPPLDGHYILEGLGPPWVAQLYDQLRPFGFMILLLLSYLGILSMIIRPAGYFAIQLILYALTGVWI